MTDFLTIAGTPYDVVTTGAVLRVDSAVDVQRTFDRSLRSVGAAPKRILAVTLAPMALADYSALAALVAGGDLVTCGGAALGGVDVACSIAVSDAPISDDGNLGFTVQPSLVLTEA
jgi:hypothetical protein